MTGYGAGSAPLPEGELLARVRAVNHRFLDLRVRLPDALLSLAPEAERALRPLARGRVELRVDLQGAVRHGVTLHEERARAAIEQLRRLRDDVAPNEPFPWSVLSMVPDLFEPAEARLDPDTCRQALRCAIAEAVAQLDAMRCAEGRALEEDLSQRLDRVGRMVGCLADEAPNLTEGITTKLRARLLRLLPEGLPLDPDRLAHEVALLAERADVTEELTRLESHVRQFRTLMERAEEEPVGRRLDFLVQEMAREANTTAAKCADAALRHVVIELKAELERIREQVQNVL